MRHIKDGINRIKEQGEAVLPVGMKFLNEYLGGLYPGEMTVICGAENAPPFMKRKWLVMRV